MKKETFLHPLICFSILLMAVLISPTNSIGNMVSSSTNVTIGIVVGGTVFCLLVAVGINPLKRLFKREEKQNSMEGSEITN